MAAIAEVCARSWHEIVEDSAHALGPVWSGPKGAIYSVGANANCDLTISLPTR